jgi:hypothetical protein
MRRSGMYQAGGKDWQVRQVVDRRPVHTNIIAAGGLRRGSVERGHPRQRQKCQQEIIS